MDASVLMGRLGPFRNAHTMLVADQSTGDIIDAITTAHKMHAPEYSRISSFFNAGSKKEVARKIYNFMDKNIKYVIEPGSRQTVKSPAAILATGHGDCKHFSLFAGGILQNLGIPFAYRFASYKTFDKQPQHVFVVIDPGTDKEIWIDPVVKEFDYHKPYTYAKDKKMALYSISGIKKAAKKATPKTAATTAASTQVKAASQAAKKTAGSKLKKGAKVILKVAAAPVRNAFLLLVTVNFTGLATKLKAAWEKAPTKVQHFWEGAGGAIDALKKAWEKGSNKKRIFGGDSIGAAPVAATAATAAPLLVKVAEVFKSIGIDPAELVQAGKDAVTVKARELAKKALEPKAATEATNIEEGNQAFETPGTTTMTPKPNFLPWVIGGAAVYFLAIRK